MQQHEAADALATTSFSYAHAAQQPVIILITKTQSCNNFVVLPRNKNEIRFRRLRPHFVLTVKTFNQLKLKIVRPVNCDTIFQ